MRTLILSVENLKCGGCEQTVRKILSEVDGVKTIKANSLTGQIEVVLGENLNPDEQIKHALKKAGYPSDGQSNLRDLAVSYLSCAKGRLNN